MHPVLSCFDVHHRIAVDVGAVSDLTIMRVYTYSAELAVEIVEVYGHQVVGVVQV